MGEEFKRDYTQVMGLFQSTAPEMQTTANLEDKTVVELSISLLNPFPEHPFELYTGEKFEDLVESIKVHGVLTPLLVRKMPDNTYQILSGHNRCAAAKKANFRSVPCIVLNDLTDDDALMILLDSNTKQRGITEMKISDQAHIYALDVAVNKRQGKRSDLIRSIEQNLEILSGDAGSGTLSQFDTKLDTLSNIGGKYGISRATIARLLRIDTLIYQLKERIDDEEFAINAGVELSYLSDIDQEVVDEVLCEYNYKLDIKKAQQLRSLAMANKLNKVTVVDVFEGRYNKPKAKSKPVVKSYTVQSKLLSKYYTPETAQTVIAEEVEASIDMWQELKKKYPGLSVEEVKNKITELLKTI